MKIRFEFLPNEVGATETILVEGDRFDQFNGWIIALKNETVVFATNEKYIKYVWLYDEGAKKANEK